MQMSKLVPNEQGYLINPDNGEKVIFWECDPTKNILCTKSMCRGCSAGSDAENGFCATTPERAFAKEGAKPFYKRLNSDGYFSREYIEGEGGGDDD